MYFYTFEKKIHFLKLAIDIGNTSTKLALFEAKNVFATAAINKCNLKNIQKFVANKEISATIISSVKEINSEISSIADYYKAIVLSENTPVPIKNHYKTPNTLGKKGEYIGGRISPGIEMRYKALHTFTNKLPLVKKGKTTPFIGDDTNSSISSGVQQGILAEVRSIISEYRLEKPDALAVVTGGDCFFFEKELKNSIFANPNLVLIGLNEILDFNE